MDMGNSILKDTRKALGLIEDNSEFDSEILMLINSAIVKLNQNGVGNNLTVADESATWLDLQDPSQTEGNKNFNLAPLFIALSAKLIFDPPPPSSVEYHTRLTDEILWRMKVTYESAL